MISNRIKELREDKDIKQVTISQQLNITQQTYSNYESGKRQIPVEMLVKIALYYNTSIDYLVGITNEKKPYPRVWE